MVKNIQFRDDLDKVIWAMKEMKKGSDDVNLVLVFSGGGARAAVNIGQCCALLQRGFGPEICRAIVGNSAGAAVALYYGCGSKALKCGTEFFINELHRYIDLRRIWNIFDIEGLMTAMRSGPYAADIKIAAREPEMFFCGAVDEEKNYRLLDVSRYGWDAIEASMLFKTVVSSRKGVCIEGRHYSDGGVYQAPLKQIAERTDATHILYFANVTEGTAAKATFAQKYLAFEEKIGRSKSSADTRRAIEESTRLGGIDSLRDAYPDIPVGVFWAPSFLKNLSMFRAKPFDMYDIFTASKQAALARLSS